MYHTKVSFAGGSHWKDWSRSADQGAVAEPWGMPVKTAPSGNSQPGVGAVLGAAFPTPPNGKD